MNNPIIEEVREAREALAEKFDFDLHRIVSDALERQKGQRTVNRQTYARPSLNVAENRDRGKI